MTPARRSPADRLKSYVFIVVGALLFGGAVCWAWSTHAFVGAASRAPGRVTRLNAGGAHPQIAFWAADGQTYSYPQGGLIAGYKVGDRVLVLYDPQHPQQGAVVDTFGALWGFPLLMGLLGLVFVGGGWLLLDPKTTWLAWR